jgi:hypothetical protein
MFYAAPETLSAFVPPLHKNHGIDAAEDVKPRLRKNSSFLVQSSVWPFYAASERAKETIWSKRLMLGQNLGRGLFDAATTPFAIPVNTSELS